ncbi:PadR family transcriptional regulator [Amycolatopsis rubida]|uniref:DNA-binding transcriptional regulator, PadR family n=1 Tax=Amycolatopsis rubida TaxID=112413 RepID=A0A1I5THZ6_9PSEU|nr:PadR family transcriptional regulator [Amycolatopsis rubida]SFP82645.1 DNA-binding transcriptional regulator, PadR family [Amycolatopsis rubida]
MSASRQYQPTPLALAVLGLLSEAPMHPYRMLRLIRERGKDQVVNVSQRKSVYQMIDRLERVGLIRVKATAKDENRPERTVYELTEEGVATARSWETRMLSTPGGEYPSFPAALAFLPLLEPDEALATLRVRVEAIEAELARFDAALAGDWREVPRLFLLEIDYLQASMRTELAWVRGVADELASGSLTWDGRQLRAEAAARDASG